MFESNALKLDDDFNLKINRSTSAQEVVIWIGEDFLE
jgi:hypothetical protein